MRFVSSESDINDAEEKFWERLRSAMGPEDTGVAYQRYPVIDNTADYDREADFVLFLQDKGLIIIECKGYQIDHIDSIQGSKWELTGISQNSASPYTQARDQGFRLKSHFTKEPSLMDERANCKVSVNFLVTLPNITREEWEARGFDEVPAAPNVILKDDLTPKALRERIYDQPGESLEKHEYEAALSVLRGSQPISGDRVPLEDPGTKGEIIEAAERGLKELDKKQAEAALQNPDGPQQIRGIAGSGKTILMAKKAADLHAKHPDWEICLTFNTRSLYPTITEKVRRFYAYATDGEPNLNKLRIIHGWGGSRKEGLYYLTAKEAGVDDYDYPEARDEFGDDGNLLDKCCNHLLENGNIQERYDAILIDEAQDFESNFYNMCYEALKPPKRLYWAYDEAQNLGTLTAPSPKKVFGTDEDGQPAVDMSGSYQGDIQKSIVMRRSYRTPKPVLMTAHAFGMGLLRDQGVVQTITTQEGWENIGYEVLSGDFRKYGEEIELTRPDEYSSSPISEYLTEEPLIRQERFESKRDEVEWVGDKIADDIENEDLSPKEVLVIPLGYRKSKSVGSALEEYLGSKGIDVNIVWRDEYERDVFKKEDEVTVSRVGRAKGNESSAVYVMNIEDVAGASDIVRARNKAFVGMTRTRGWCRVTGTHNGEDLFDELEEVVDLTTAANPVIKFPAPQPDSLEREMDEDIETTLGDFT